jgi:choline dehydrogenase
MDEREAIREFVREQAVSYHHVCGTCKMGIDDMAVVDPALRVYGISGLRVADASVMPTVTSGNTMAPTYLIGERAAALVLDEWMSSRDTQTLTSA